ncbi:hypothetical protein QQF64_016678 [Cirrhinus molitorella]|uniref:Uncharacterized protein n=1 Tax=Cirrhinus molitorella TaxID=172907 RepID=A0ABR3LNF7_9TELE
MDQRPEDEKDGWCCTYNFMENMKDFVFHVPLQIYAGLNHVTASQFIVKEPNSLTKQCSCPMPEDSHLERR